LEEHADGHVGAVLDGDAAKLLPDRVDELAEHQLAWAEEAEPEVGRILAAEHDARLVGAIPRPDLGLGVEVAGGEADDGGSYLALDGGAGEGAAVHVLLAHELGGADVLPPVAELVGAEGALAGEEV